MGAGDLNLLLEACITAGKIFGDPQVENKVKTTGLRQNVISG